MNRFLAPLFGVLLAGAASAQITHNVAVGPNFEFVPDDLTVMVGDTVQWDWSGGFQHNVESGVGSVPDGIFTSGFPVIAPATFSVTFDQPFLAANPVPGNAYDYYCIVHESFFGMDAVIRVMEPYSCLNPPGSLVTISGAPHINTTWVVGVDNPVPGGQTPGSLAFLGISIQPQLGFPCGLPLPGFHMDPLQPAGEILIDIFPPNPILSQGPVLWPGPLSPAPFPLPIPPTPTLVGIELYTQGLILDPGGPNTWGASEGIKTTIGG